jgi:hypothetical protein
MILLGETLREAQEKKERLNAGRATNIDARLAALFFFQRNGLLQIRPR